MAKTHGIEEYLEAIYVLSAERSRVIPSVLADYLGVARPTVTQTLQRMERAGTAIRTLDHEIQLTDKGLKLAEAVVRKHRLIERWLADKLGLDWADAHMEACRLEHAISPLVEERLWEHLGHPTTCPHGNIIPGSQANFVIGVPLSKCRDGEQVSVVRILEQAEENLDLMRFYYRAGLVPGATVTVIRGATPYEAGIEVQVEDETYVLEPNIAERVMVDSPDTIPDDASLSGPSASLTE